MQQYKSTILQLGKNKKEKNSLLSSEKLRAKSYHTWHKLKQLASILFA